MADILIPVTWVDQSRVQGSRIAVVHGGATVNIRASVGAQAKPLIRMAPLDIVRFEVAIVEGGIWSGAVLQVYYSITGLEWVPLSGATIGSNGITAAYALEAVGLVTLQLTTQSSEGAGTQLVQVNACLTDGGRQAVE